MPEVKAGGKALGCFHEVEYGFWALGSGWERGHILDGLVIIG